MSEHNVDKNSQLFVGLVASLSSQAWMQMGKIKNPTTDKIERNLDGASMSMKAKTEGNLSDEENNFVEQTLRDLQMNFVSEKNKPEPKEEKSEEESAEKEEKSKAEPEENK